MQLSCPYMENEKNHEAPQEQAGLPGDEEVAARQNEVLRDIVERIQNDIPKLPEAGASLATAWENLHTLGGERDEHLFRPGMFTGLQTAMEYIVRHADNNEIDPMMQAVVTTFHDLWVLQLRLADFCSEHEGEESVAAFRDNVKKINGFLLAILQWQGYRCDTLKHKSDMQTAGRYTRMDNESVPATIREEMKGFSSNQALTLIPGISKHGKSILPVYFVLGEKEPTEDTPS